MKSTSLPRVLIGICIVLIGVLAALGAVDLINFGEIVIQWWPLLPIALGGIMLFSHNLLWGTIFSGFGILMLARTMDLIVFNIFELFWPSIIIIVGLSILFNRGVSAFKTDKTSDDVTAILGGISSVNTSSSYVGGKATAVMGGVTLDLRKATIAKEATLQVLSFWGGVEVKVPEDWVVKNRTNAVLGGVDVKTTATTKKGAPILYIVGDVIMAGVDVKY